MKIWEIKYIGLFWFACLILLCVPVTFWIKGIILLILQIVILEAMSRRIRKETKEEK